MCIRDRPLEAQGNPLFFLRRRAEAGIEAQVKCRRPRHHLLAMAEELRLHYILTGLGFFQRELLGAVAAGEVARVGAALIGQAIAVIRPLAVGVRHPQINVGIVGIPGCLLYTSRCV